jgi:hypothetical protein
VPSGLDKRPALAAQAHRLACAKALLGRRKRLNHEALERFTDRGGPSRSSRRGIGTSLSKRAT